MPANFLRYPGGKSKVVNRLLPYVLPLLDGRQDYCEPFIGGGAMAIAIAEKCPNSRLWINDLNPGVAAVWTVLAKRREVSILIRILSGWHPSISMFRRLQKSRPTKTVDRAARFVALNRMAFSGKAHTTPIGGWKQNGKWKIDAEWRIEHVIKNLMRASEILSQHQTIVTCQDFVGALHSGAATYLDPPYYHMGNNMYDFGMSVGDHKRLAQQILRRKNWVLSYDECPEVREMYRSCAIDKLEWSYSANIGANHLGQELVITPPK